MSLEQVGIDVPLIRLRHIRLFALEEDTLCEQMKEVDEALWKALSNHQQGPSFPLPKSVPQGPLDKSQLHVKQPSEVGGETHSTPQPTHLSFNLLQSTLSEVWTFPGRYTSMGYPVS